MHADFTDQFEKGWLILADLYVASGKFDLAQELCKKCLKVKTFSFGNNL